MATLRSPAVKPMIPHRCDIGDLRELPGAPEAKKWGGFLFIFFKEFLYLSLFTVRGQYCFEGLSTLWWKRRPVPQVRSSVRVVVETKASA